MNYNKLKTYITNLFNKDKRFLTFAKINHFYPDMPDDEYLIKKWKALMGTELNLDDPHTFNEKLQWLKLYDRKPEYTTMVDKYAVKQYVADIIGEKHIIPTLGVWDKFDDIDFNMLPNQFVLKCTHDSGGLVICRDKQHLDKNAAKKKLTESLKHNYYYAGREYPYKNVKPRIIAEKYMEDSKTAELRDYKFFCFDENVYCCLICSGRYSSKGLHFTFFDRKYNVLPFECGCPSEKNGLPKPSQYDKMIELAEQLSQNIPFVRVDFYEIDGNVYFGELTFFPVSGYIQFDPEEWDLKLGNMLKLPEKKSELK